MVDIDFARPFRQFVDDPLGAVQKVSNQIAQIPLTRTQTSYGLTIHAQVGNKRAVIGAVNRISLNETMELEEVYEVDKDARGLPRELIPQILSNRTLQLSRYELYAAQLKEVFGTPELFTLLDQTGPLNLRLSWKFPGSDSVLSVIPHLQQDLRIYMFANCYFTNLGKTISADDVIVRSEGTIVWGNLLRLQ